MCPLHVTSHQWLFFREYDLIHGWKSVVVAVRRPSLSPPLSLLPCSMYKPVRLCLLSHPSVYRRPLIAPHPLFVSGRLYCCPLLVP